MSHPHMVAGNGRMDTLAMQAIAGVALKTGAGGIMDVDFLAKGAQLECGTASIPAVAEMLQAAVPPARVATLLDDYRFLRLVEARMRWVAGRPVELLNPDPEHQAVVAELVEPGLDASGLRERLAQTRARVADTCERVLRAGTISALAE